jgi:hypothetical protein
MEQVEAGSFHEMVSPKRFKCLACEVFARPAYLAAAESSSIVDVELLPKGLHDRAEDLRLTLQEKIDACSGYDAILLAYGLCGRATAGLVANRIPLVLPRAHDCITLFLGSRSHYQKEFEREPGTYWYVRDYLERQDGRQIPLSTGANEIGTYESWVEKYGKDNADYLLATVGKWETHYDRGVYIDFGLPGEQETLEYARRQSQARGWRFQILRGDFCLLKQLLNGEWGDDFLVVPEGRSVEMITGEDIIQIR